MKNIKAKIKPILIIATVIISAIFIVACSTESENIEITSEVTIVFDNEILDEFGVDRMYLVTISIRQTHVWWQFIDRLRDNVNSEEIVIPVMEEWFHSVEIGEVLEDSFRWGSLFLSGASIGNWDIRVIGKQIVIRE